MRSQTQAVAVVVVLAVAGCASISVDEQRMVAAPSRPADCALEYVNDSATSPGFMQKWQLLGYVAVRVGQADPLAQATRDLVRPHACGMGGAAVTMLMDSKDLLGGDHLTFAVLRPQPTTEVHATF
jgi:hypothetical protein